MLISIAGSPCVDYVNSKQGTEGKAGHTASTFLTIATLHVQRATPIVCFENVQQFDDACIYNTLGATYVIVKLCVSPADTGFSCNSRDRAYHLCFHKEKVHMVGNVQEVYNDIKKELGQSSVHAKHIWFEDRVDVLHHETDAVGKHASWCIIIST